ncbi:bZIP transcription factor 44 isoform X2 [Physcomitrium patens]|uniref:BZIP domain-containing protein n=1 Tax=Physcomitrium patens TaxID=3218 RepID=A0A2K1JC48_PHYPA|nr:bZIP transcription factor 44-like isoform X2 [Physcomitrium patens]PNR39099.1 hypothetical protein PHYPA_019377 [Physcomitrium patens]|eukprot:XP_024396092.1 bZIP transcription factor 44-like isoform X2 [Physcomitrella patens]
MTFLRLWVDWMCSHWGWGWGVNEEREVMLRCSAHVRFQAMFEVEQLRSLLLAVLCAGPNLALDVNHLDISGLSRDYYEGERHDIGGDTSFSPRVNNLEGQSNFTSDDDQVVVDERRQKRMISNRESARRSRLRKQQHLDELRSQIAQLRAENTHMLNRFSLASQQYAQLTEENCVLRSNATDMRHQLQMLHHAASSHQPLSLERGLGTVQPLPLNLSLCSGLTEDANW